MNRVFWTEQQQPMNTSFTAIFDSLRNEDMQTGLLYEPCSVTDILDEAEQITLLDAIVAPFAKLEMKMRQLNMALNRASGEIKIAGMQITDPFMRLGTANVAVLFELSDGQTISIFFHNPDTTPKKIAPQDDVISYKWVLNKKDVTILVAPERGADINIREVAMRVMKLAEKNSAAFAKQNAKRAEKVKRIEEMEQRITEKEKTLEKLYKEIDLLEATQSMKETDEAIDAQEMLKALEAHKAFFSKSQYKTIQDALKGEESTGMVDTLKPLFKRIDSMPKSYETDGQGNDAVAQLHYFVSNGDFYITEKDMSGAGTRQAFGMTVMNGDPELGYISIDEITSANAELDLYWTPKTLEAIKKADEPAEDEKMAKPLSVLNIVMDIVSPFLKEKIGFNFQSGGGANPLGLPDAGNIFTFTASSESTRLSTFLTIEKTGDTFTTEMYGYKANGERVGLTRGTDLPFDEKTIGDVARAFAANTLKFVKSEQDNSETVTIDVPNDYRITFQGGVSLNAGAIRQAIENSSYGGAEGDRERIDEDLKKVRTGELNAEFIQSEYGHHYISSAIRVVSTLMKAKESGDAPTYLYARAWLNNDEVNVKQICRTAAIETLGVPLKVGAQNRSWDEWLVKFLNLNQAEVEQYEAEREKYRQQESEEAERKKKEELQQEAAVKAEKDAEEARLAEALGLTPNTLAARRAVADLTKNNPRRLELKDGTRVVVNNRKERVEKAIEDGNTDLQVRYKVRKSENNIIGKEKFYWDYVSEKEYNQAKEKGLKVAMEYFLQGEDKLGFELNKYEYDYAKFLLSQQNKATEEPIEVTGKEFGEFDTSTKEGKKALREKVFKYLTNLADIKEKVYCQELKAEVGFTKSGAKKFKKFGADILKLKLAAKIKQIIALGKKFKPSHNSYDPKEKQYGIVYHYLKTPVKIDGIEYGARVVIREDNNGKLHYDLQVKDSVNAILDSVNTNTVGSNEVNKAPVPHRIDSISAVGNDNRSKDEEMQDILDDTDSGRYVLNLFVEYQDENGNWVELKDEEDEPETETSQTQERLVNEYQHDLLLAFEWAKERFHIDKEELLKLATFLTSDKSASDYQEELPFFHPASAKADFENVLGMGVDSNMNINALLDLIKQRFKHTEDKEVNGQQGIGDLLVNSFNQLSGSLEQLLNLPSDSVMTSKDENNLKASLSYVGKSGEMLNITLLNQKEELLTKTSIFTKEVGKKEAQYKFSPESTVEQVVDTIVQALQPLKSKQAEQEDKTVNSANQQEQQDRAFLEKTIAGDFDALSDEFEQQITEIAERYDGTGGEMEALMIQAVDAYSAVLDKLSA
ncbi:hypothetical protein [Gallibacterium anatis]|uniref:defense against restriction DarA-related protein n=1 Tax=Gallibacterium anatis TaxID=750 RepID=UPI00068DDA4E|nr:hypothetical protein [Gallibacterium anatis]